MRSQAHSIIHRLSLIPGVGSGTIVTLLEHLGLLDEVRQLSASESGISCLQALPTLTVSQLALRVGLSRAVAQRIEVGLQDQREFEQELCASEHEQVRICTILDADYPDGLRSLHIPPAVLYIKGGHITDMDRSLAIVGSRAAGSYARNVIAHVLPDIVKAGFSIVSGGARGVDTFAHEQTLNLGGHTTVVLGSGLQALYPKENTQLFDQVVDAGGCLVSPFPLQATPQRGNFPARNRIISGLSRGCLLVQAAQKSGARITAKFALEQGKSVFAVPGSIFDEYSAGVHDLIKQGACLVSSSDDIFDEFGCSVTPSTKQDGPLVPTEKQVSITSNPILTALDRPCSLDELAGHLDKNPMQLQQELFLLQLEQKVSQNFAGLWVRT